MFILNAHDSYTAGNCPFTTDSAWLLYFVLCSTISTYLQFYDCLSLKNTHQPLPLNIS